VMLNSWEILGQFMYPASAYRRLLDLLRSGLLDISAIRSPRCRRRWKPPARPAILNTS
jgi:hypothetical protein